MTIRNVTRRLDLALFNWKYGFRKLEPFVVTRTAATGQLIWQRAGLHRVIKIKCEY